MKYETLWRRLASIYDTDEAKAIVRWMLDVRFGLSLTDIVCGKTDELNEEECAELEGMMQRLEKGEPVQYVMGVAEFCGRRFHVEPGVLIPRPETGELCEIISEAREYQRDDQILDIGTGSGCIAITLALELPCAKVIAWDISEKALSIAKKNAEALGAEVTFEQRDILQYRENSNIFLTIPEQDSPTRSLSHLSHLSSKYDLIVSNPPYVCNREKATMERHVLEHEPHLALFVPNDDPLLFYRAITHFAKEALKPNGLLYFELNPLYACETEAMVCELGFSETEIKLDMFGKQRFLKAKKI
jgi:release factor glutamine methyltransferase